MFTYAPVLDGRAVLAIMQTPVDMLKITSLKMTEHAMLLRLMQEGEVS